MQSIQASDQKRPNPFIERTHSGLRPPSSAHVKCDRAYARPQLKIGDRIRLLRIPQGDFEQSERELPLAPKTRVGRPAASRRTHRRMPHKRG